MKSVFREFYNNEKVDFNNLTDDVLVVFDTNTLLNIYRYSKSTRNTFLKSLEQVKNNIWVPYQVGLEFNLNRREVMIEMEDKGKSISENIESISVKYINEIKAELNKYPIKSIDGSEKRKEIANIFEEKVNALQKEFFEKEFIKLENLIDKDDDKMMDLANIFDGKVGQSFSRAEIEEICKEGEERYAKDIPPGYKDTKGKKGKITIYNNLEFESKYGDLILWKQIIKKTKDEKKRMVVIVSDDQKEDWWYEIKGKKIGARAELKNELIRETEADLILMNSNTFIRETSQETVKSDLVEIESNLPPLSPVIEERLNENYMKQSSWFEETLNQRDVDKSIYFMYYIERLEILREDVTKKCFDLENIILTFKEREEFDKDYLEKFKLLLDKYLRLRNKIYKILTLDNNNYDELTHKFKIYKAQFTLLNSRFKELMINYQ